MIPAPFAYVRATSVADAIEALSGDPEAKILAGGHSLLPAMKLRVARPSTLVDIGRIEGLSGIREEGEEIVIGALTRHHDVASSELLHDALPIAAYAAAQIGDPAVRHIGTIGGSIAHGDPAGDMPAVLLVLDASFVATGPGGATRTIPAAAFFTGPFGTALAPAEVLTHIRIRRPVGGQKDGQKQGWSFVKFNRRAQDWALVGVSVVRTNDGVRVGLTNMGLTPLRATAVEQRLAAGADPHDAAAHADDGTAPPDDASASAEYRRALVKVLVERALREALG